MRKSLIITFAVLLGLGLVSIAGAKAATQTVVGQTLVERIATRFGLDQTDVQVEFDAFHTEKRAQMQATMTEKLNTRLDELVADGSITDAQKTAILAKIEERKAEMLEGRDGLESWAKQNGIDSSLLPKFMMLGNRGHHKGGIRGNMVMGDMMQ